MTGDGGVELFDLVFTQSQLAVEAGDVLAAVLLVFDQLLLSGGLLLFCGGQLIAAFGQLLAEMGKFCRQWSGLQAGVHQLDEQGIRYPQLPFPVNIQHGLPGSLRIGSHTKAASLGDAIDGAASRYMQEVAVLRQLQPEIPVLIDVELFVDVAALIPQIAGKQDGMDGHEVFGQQTQAVVRLIEYLLQYLTIVIDTADAAVGNMVFRCGLQGSDQTVQMVGVEPVVIVEENQVVAACCGQAEIGGAGAVQGMVAIAIDPAQRQPSPVFRQGAVRRPSGIDQHDLDVRPGLPGYRVECLIQRWPIHAADEDADQRHVCAFRGMSEALALRQRAFQQT